MNLPSQKAAVVVVAADVQAAVAPAVTVVAAMAAERASPQARPGVGVSPAAVVNPAASAQRDLSRAQTDTWCSLCRGGAACCSATRLYSGASCVLHDPAMHILVQHAVQG